MKDRDLGTALRALTEDYERRVVEQLNREWLYFNQVTHGAEWPWVWERRKTDRQWRNAVRLPGYRIDHLPENLRRLRRTVKHRVAGVIRAIRGAEVDYLS